MKKKLNITVLVDEAEITGSDPNFENTPDAPTTEYHVIDALRCHGHNVSVLGALSDITKLISALKEQNPDIVFNLTEQFAGDRRLDKNVVALLEMAEIPFTGAGVMGLLLCRDKRLCKQLLSLHKIRVPGFAFLLPGKRIRVPKNLKYPLVVKPAFEDSSEGISNASLVANENALKERVQFVHQKWEQAAIAEEYIKGRELYVTVMGNKKLSVFPIRECFFKAKGDEGPVMATYRVKWDESYREKWNITFGFAELDETALQSIQHICKRTYRILQLRDYARIDIKLTDDNKVVILEANPNPDIAYGEEVAEAAEKNGLKYEQLIERILKIAIRRYS